MNTNFNVKQSMGCFKAPPPTADLYSLSRGVAPETHRHAVGELLGREAETVVLGLQPSALRLQHLPLQVLL